MVASGVAWKVDIKVSALAEYWDVSKVVGLAVCLVYWKVAEKVV